MANRAQRSEKELRAKAKSVYRQLAEVYGQPTWRRHNDPVSELVLTFLSQNTSDVNSHRAFKQLKERYPTWDAVLAASTEELADTIRSGGLADIKAPRIRDALQRILDERGEFSLEFLGSLPVKQAQRYLTSIKGIGHKSAAIVLLFCFGKPVFPVDTHVHRVSHRLGLVSPKNSRGLAKEQPRTHAEDVGDAGPGRNLLLPAPESHQAWPKGVHRGQTPLCRMCAAAALRQVSV